MILTINKLRLRTTVGVYDWEKTRPRDVIVTLRMTFDGEKAVKSDDIEDTIDYDSLSSLLQNEIEPTKHYLVEKLTDQIADLVMANTIASWVEVTVEKPGVPAFAESILITLERHRS